MMEQHNWILELDVNNIIWMGFDLKNSDVNVLNSVALDELSEHLLDLEKNKQILGLIIYSCKSSGFIAGADIRQFANFKDSKEARDYLAQGHKVFNQLSNIDIPTVAMIDGFCLGGGLELSLACRYRVASQDESTRLGLPEVLLGIHPGWGGTVRLPRLIGGFQALTQVMLSGRMLSAKHAKNLGIVDVVVPRRQLKRAACDVILTHPKAHQPTFFQKTLDLTILRPLLAKIINNKLRKTVNEKHYPAPFAMVNLWQNMSSDFATALDQEIDSVVKLIEDSETSKQLMRVFLLKDKLKAAGKKSKFRATKVHVVGAGTMGGDIAAWCALHGMVVTLQDRALEFIAPAIKRAYSLYEKKLKQPAAIQQVLDRLIPDVNGDGIASADVIIEAIPENIELKQAWLKDTEAKAKKDAIIATNTSSIPLDELNTVMQNPARLVGIHFFNPVAKMELVEIVYGQKTSNTVYDAAAAFVGQIKKLPLLVKSGPGFLVNRILMPYLLQAVLLLDEGYDNATIDAAAKWFGMAMGPIELADAVGLDVALAVAKHLVEHLGGAVPVRLQDMVAKGKLGKKSGEGFYSYRNGKLVSKSAPNDSQLPILAKRLLKPYLQEAKACLEEGVVTEADLLDAAMIFGTGFAPFLGGPMLYQAHHPEA
jgi:3-hydroxyacyl-CoA dehydrogenase/enoyl-CoA hydratase/3-hydroxybutyryl-CoA epimerase